MKKIIITIALFILSLYALSTFAGQIVLFNKTKYDLEVAYDFLRAFMTDDGMQIARSDIKKITIPVKSKRNYIILETLPDFDAISVNNVSASAEGQLKAYGSFRKKDTPGLCNGNYKSIMNHEFYANVALIFSDVVDGSPLILCQSFNFLNDIN